MTEIDLVADGRAMYLATGPFLQPQGLTDKIRVEPVPAAGPRRTAGGLLWRDLEQRGPASRSRGVAPSASILTARCTQS